MLLDTHINYIHKEITTSGIALTRNDTTKNFPTQKHIGTKKETPKGLLNFSRIS